MIQKREILPKVPLYYSIPLLVICISALIILIFLFRIEYPELLLQPVPSNAINISSCGVLSQNNAYYLVNQTLNATGFAQVNYGGCLMVNASNVIVDGNGQNVVGSLGLAYNVMNLSGSNVTVKGFNVSDVSSSILRNGIISYGSENRIFNNQFSNVSEYAIYSKGNSNAYAIGTSIYNNTLIEANFGIFLHHTNNSFVYNNFIRSNNATSAGIYLLNAYENNLNNNIIRDTNYSILLWVSDNNVISDNLVYTPRSVGIGFVSSELNSVIRTNIISPRRIGISAFPNSFANIDRPTINLINVSVIDGNASHFDIEVPYFSGANNYLNHSFNISGGYIARYKLNNTHLIFSDSSGFSKISFNVPLIAVGNNLTDHVRAGFNFAEVKSNLNSDLNKSASITFTGLPTNIENYVVLRDGVACPSSICYNLVNLTAETVIFNVTGWTNYSVSGVASQTPLVVNINEPSNNEAYLTSSFPVTFGVSLNINGSVKFSLNNGSTNITMATANNRDFTFVQSSLPIGNYSFIVYANSTTGLNVTRSNNFTVSNQISSGAQSLSISEPDPNEQYTTASFPVTFIVTLNALNGSVKFSLNNGSTNVTMVNDSSGVEFEHIQNSLSAGNYTFVAFANFTNGTRITGRVNFSVINTTGSSTGAGSSGGSSGGGGSGGSGGSSGGSVGGVFAGSSGGTTGSQFNSSTFGTTGTGGTQTLTPQSSSSSALRNMVYWLLIAVLSIMIVILSLLIIKAIKQRKKVLSIMGSGVVSKSPGPVGLISNLR